jgi:regulator of sigma E protease
MEILGSFIRNFYSFVLVLGFLIFAHEAGHFMLAKLFKVRVLVFSFGFGKRLFGFKYGDTDYRVSLIPLGGYVRMAGDTPEENVPGNPDEFLSKPKWQRFLILVAGPAMNIVIAITFVAALAIVGMEQVIMKPVLGSVDAGKAGAKAGLQAGDEILALKGEKVDDFADMAMIISMNAGTPIEVVYKRDGVTRKTILTPDRAEGDFGPVGRAHMGSGFEPVVGKVEPNTPAAAAGLRTGDRIVSANGQPVHLLEDFAKVSRDTATKPVAIVVDRAGQQINATLAPTTDEKLGPLRGFLVPTRFFKLAPIPALRHSISENWRMLKYAMSALGRLFRREGSMKELSGPINIARIAGEMVDRGWTYTIGLMAMISLQLGVMNLLPIPVLDGGHIMILLIEGIARRDLSLRVKERIQQVGFAALATLMLVVLYNDVITNVLRLRNG